jgi:hypothetical protein
MTAGFVFWLLMLLWVIFWGVRSVHPTALGGFAWGGDVLMFILFFLIGWHVFGWPIHG